MPETITFLDALVESLLRASSYNKNDQVPPVAVLWPDREQQWASLIPVLRDRLPLLALGPYDPEQRTGPAYWLRCMIAGTLPEDRLPERITPIVYLPGVSRQEIRAIEECPKMLQPLAELQYRGVLWTQRNARDWTIAAFLQTKDGGLEVEVGADQATREALQRALLKLSGEPIAHLRTSAPLRAPFFDALLTPDDVRSLLSWLDDPLGYPTTVAPEEWGAFCEVSRIKYGFHPEKDGPLHAAQLLGQRYGAWYQVWERYTEAPHAYPNLPERLRNARPGQVPLFDRTEGWPQDNEVEEDDLRQGLAGLEQHTPQDARAALYELEERHAPRREWVWARLDEAPLAVALKHLVELAKAAEHPLGGTTLDKLVAAYAERGWQADAAALEALAAVERLEDVTAVKATVRAVYRPWLEAAACAFQGRIKAGDLQGQTGAPLSPVHEGTCIVFSDALRYDAGQRLAAALEAHSYHCQVTPQLAALPPITSTAKPALSPVAAALTGISAPTLNPLVADTGSQLTAAALRKLLADAGYQVLLNDDELGDPSGRAWTEIGAIDGYGHQHGWKIAHHISGELRAVQQRVEALIDHGWARVIVVTDHGWLMLPGDLPKADLPEHLTAVRKGRCARLKPLADTDQQTVPWFWDEDVRIAMAPGLCCYVAGKEYEHGGLSLQECVVPVITITSTDASATIPVEIEAVKWRGLRCVVQLNGATAEMAVDIRTKAGDASTSLVVVQKSPDPDGSVSLLVEDEDRIGEAAFVIVVSKTGLARAQVLTTVGG